MHPLSDNICQTFYSSYPLRHALTEDFLIQLRKHGFRNNGVRFGLGAMSDFELTFLVR